MPQHLDAYFTRASVVLIRHEEDRWSGDFAVWRDLDALPRAAQLVALWRIDEPQLKSRALVTLIHQSQLILISHRVAIDKKRRPSHA
jgi:hypothetical protein